MAQVKQIDQNQDNNQQNDQQGQPQTLAGSTQSSGPAPSSGRIASFSSGSQPQASGRFTNLQKYMDANKSATGNLGARANQTINKGFNQGQTELEKSNEQIAENYGKGQQTLQQGQGFKTQLGQIGQNLNTFQDYTNRNQFDAAGEQAQQLAQNQDYARIASGQGIDQSGLQNQQTAAQQQAQNLLKTAQTNLGNIQTEQGRDTLFSQVLQPKQGYSTGQRNFDKLFLGGALGGIQQNLQGKQTLANQLLGTTQGQQSNLDTLFKDESSLLKDLSTQAKSNVNTFYNKLNDPNNIDLVNQLRKQQYDSLVNNLKNGGTLSADQAALLGITPASNLTSGNISSKVGVEGSTPATQTKYQANLYNLLKDPANISNYISQGAEAKSLADLISQQDYNNFGGLANLVYSNGQQQADTRITGPSSINSAVQAGKSGDITQLGKDISSAANTFNQDIANNKYGVNQTGRWADVNLGSQQGMNLINSLTPQQKELLKNFNPAQPGGIYNLYSQQGMADVLNQVPLNVKSFANDANNINSDAGGANYSMRAQAIQSLINQLENAGYGNSLTVDPNAPVNPNKRFGNII